MLILQRGPVPFGLASLRTGSTHVKCTTRLSYVCRGIDAHAAPNHPLPPMPGRHVSDTAPHACLGPMQIVNAYNGMLE